MAKVQVVDYEAMPKRAKQIRQYAKDINSELTLAYESITEMHNSWYGKRYSELVKEFNKIIPEVNELLKLVVADIPFTLETVSNNYSQADKGANVTSAISEAAKKIANIADPSDVGMRFITAEVSRVQAEVSKHFKNAEDKMDLIESEYNKINWKSEASEAFRVKFKKLKANIIRSFENLNQSFTKLMNKTKDDMEKAEKSNTVN